MPPSSESFGLLAEFNVKKCQKVSETVYVFVFFMYVQILQIYHFCQMLDDGEKNPIIIIKSCDISPKHSCEFV